MMKVKIGNAIYHACKMIANRMNKSNLLGCHKVRFKKSGNGKTAVLNVAVVKLVFKMMNGLHHFPLIREDMLFVGVINISRRIKRGALYHGLSFSENTTQH